MRYKFWLWVHNRLEAVWHWVYRTKLHEYDCRYWSWNANKPQTVYWSKCANLDEYPKMDPLPPNYYRVNPDGSFTLLDGPTDTGVIR